MIASLDDLGSEWVVAGEQMRLDDGGLTRWQYALPRDDVLTLQRLRQRGLVVTAIRRVEDGFELLAKLAGG